MVDISTMTCIAISGPLKLYSQEIGNKRARGGVLDTETGVITELTNIQKAFKFSGDWTSVITVTSKHLPGEHDQQSHTPKKYGAGRTAGSVPKDLLPALTQSLYSGTLQELHKQRMAKRDFREQIVAGQPFQHLLEGGSEAGLQDDSTREWAKNAVVATLSRESGVDYNTVNMMIKQWTITSNGGNYQSLSLQEAVSQELGVELSDWQNGIIESTRKGIIQDYHNEIKGAYQELLAKRTRALEDKPMDEYEFATAEERQQLMKASDKTLLAWAEEKVGYPDAESYAKAQIHGYQQFMPPTDARKLIRAMYDGTQARLKDEGWDMDGNITLYRGMDNLEQDYDPGTVINYKGNAMESWSSTPWVARQFGTHMLAMSVPVRNILSTARTGFGSLPEAEFVVFGSIPGTQAVVVGW